MDFSIYKSRLKEYLISHGFSNFESNIRCFSGNHKDDIPSMQIHDDGFKCYACGVTGDIYDAVGYLEKIQKKYDQFKFIEKFFNGNNASIPPKEKFIINQDSAQKLTKYMRELAKFNTNNRLLFAKHRKYCPS